MTIPQAFAAIVDGTADADALTVLFDDPAATAEYLDDIAEDAAAALAVASVVRGMLARRSGRRVMDGERLAS